jgi:hypothetical protein
MPGTAVMSKLDSSSTMMMCGGLADGLHVSSVGSFNRSPTESSASSHPRVINSDSDSTPERVKLET